MSNNTKKKAPIFADKRFVSPVGVSKWAYLTEPDSQYDEDNHKINLYWTGEEDGFDDFVKALLDFQKKMTKQETGKAYTAALPNCMKKEEDGTYRITFKSKVKFAADGSIIPVTVVDRDKKPMPAEVWGGSLCRVAFGLGFWQTGMGSGVKCYMQAVQVIEDARSNQGAVDAFGDEFASATPSVSDEYDYEGSPEEEF